MCCTPLITRVLVRKVHLTWFHRSKEEKLLMNDESFKLWIEEVFLKALGQGPWLLILFSEKKLKSHTSAWSKLNSAPDQPIRLMRPGFEFSEKCYNLRP